MPRTPDHCKAFADSVRSIRELGQRLATLQADVVAIERLPVDDKGNADALVSVGKSVSLHTGLRLPLAAILLAKHLEVCRTLEALKSEFNEILDHATELVARCEGEPAPTAAVATPYLAAQLEREVKEMIAMSGQPRAHLSEVAEPLAPPLRPRI